MSRMQSHLTCTKIYIRLNPCSSRVLSFCVCFSTKNKTLFHYHNTPNCTHLLKSNYNGVNGSETTHHQPLSRHWRWWYCALSCWYDKALHKVWPETLSFLMHIELVFLSCDGVNWFSQQQMIRMMFCLRICALANRVSIIKAVDMLRVNYGKIFSC